MNSRRRVDEEACGWMDGWPAARLHLANAMPGNAHAAPGEPGGRLCGLAVGSVR